MIHLNVRASTTKKHICHLRARALMETDFDRTKIYGAIAAIHLDTWKFLKLKHKIAYGSNCIVSYVVSSRVNRNIDVPLFIRLEHFGFIIPLFVNPHFKLIGLGYFFRIFFKKDDTTSKQFLVI